MKAYLKDAFQVCVVGSKPMVRRGTSAEQQSHWVSFIAKGGLHPNEHVAELLAVYEQVLAL